MAGTKKKRILLICLVCDPDESMESRVGWNRTLQAAQYLDTTVICKFAPSVLRMAGELAALPSSRWPTIYVLPFTKLIQWIWKIPGMWSIAYWQRQAFKLAQQLHNQDPSHVAHQVNLATYREPGFLWRMKVPFVCCRFQ